MRKLGVLGLILSFAIVPIGLSCSGGGGGIVSPPPAPPPPPPPPPGGGTCAASTICMRAASFDPVELNVTKGAAITFDNTSSVVHDVVFDAPKDPAINDIGTIQSGQTAVRTFGASGTWNFHCTIHGGMTGKVIVP